MPSLLIGIPAFLLVINIVSCVAFVIDRQAGADGRARIPQGLLMLCVVLGGGLGMLLAVAPVLRDESRQPLSPTILTIVGLQVGIGAGIIAFYL